MIPGYQQNLVIHHNSWLQTAAISPDGRYISVTSGGFSSGIPTQLHMYSAITGRPLWTRTVNCMSSPLFSEDGERLAVATTNTALARSLSSTVLVFESLRGHLMASWDTQLAQNSQLIWNRSIEEDTLFLNLGSRVRLNTLTGALLADWQLVNTNDSVRWAFPIYDGDYLLLLTRTHDREQPGLCLIDSHTGTSVVIHRFLDVNVFCEDDAVCVCRCSEDFIIRQKADGTAQDSASSATAEVPLHQQPSVRRTQLGPRLPCVSSSCIPEQFFVSSEAHSPPPAFPKGSERGPAGYFVTIKACCAENIGALVLSFFLRVEANGDVRFELISPPVGDREPSTATQLRSPAEEDSLTGFYHMSTIKLALLTRQLGLIAIVQDGQDDASILRRERYLHHKLGIIPFPRTGSLQSDVDGHQLLCMDKEAHALSLLQDQAAELRTEALMIQEAFRQIFHIYATNNPQHLTLVADLFEGVFESTCLLARAAAHHQQCFPPPIKCWKSFLDETMQAHKALAVLSIIAAPDEPQQAASPSTPPMHASRFKRRAFCSLL